MDPQHPKQKLVFYISDDIEDEQDVNVMGEVVRKLGASRQWAIAPPVFLNESQEDPEAGELRTVGGFFQLYSALPPWADKLPKEIDRRHLEEVRATIDALVTFSAETNHEIAFELDGAQIGWIEKGVPDNSLRVGLIEEWERSLSA